MYLRNISQHASSARHRGSPYRAGADPGILNASHKARLLRAILKIFPIPRIGNCKLATVSMFRAVERRGVSSRDFSCRYLRLLYDLRLRSRDNFARVCFGFSLRRGRVVCLQLLRVREIGSSCHRSSSLPLALLARSMRERNENSRITVGALLFRSAAAKAPTNSRRSRVNKQAHSICRRAVLNGARKLAIAIILKRAPT